MPIIHLPGVFSRLMVGVIMAATLLMQATAVVDGEIGYGVWFVPLVDDEGLVTDVEGGIIHITVDKVCLRPKDDHFLQIRIDEDHYENLTTFERLPKPINATDAHDLRYRLFDTVEEAQEHLEHTINRWQTRSWWQSFVIDYREPR